MGPGTYRALTTRQPRGQLRKIVGGNGGARTARRGVEPFSNKGRGSNAVKVQMIFWNYSQICLIRTRVSQNFANSNKLFRSLENLLTKDLHNSNRCYSNFLRLKHFYDPPESSNSK